MDLRRLRYFVAVAEERHVGRAAARLQMTQPPLSRAIRQLEDELGVSLLERTPSGVALTSAGEVLYDDARSLLEHAQRVRARATSRAGTSSLAVGTLADTAEQIGSRLVAAFRKRYPHVEVTIHETDLSDPSAGLRTDLVDVALTRAPFDDTNIRTHVLRSDSIGVVVRDDDPLTQQASVALAELADRRWIHLPDGTDPIWCAYWTGGTPRGADDLPAMRTIQECLQSVLWSGASALAPLNQTLPSGLTTIPVTDRQPSQLVVAWKPSNRNTLVRSFVQTAAASHRP